MLKKTFLFVATLSLPVASWPQKCDLLQGRPSQAASYLNTVKEDARDPSCVSAAFNQIASLPSEQAVPILLAFIDYRRPLASEEKDGVYFGYKHQIGLYPAVNALLKFGIKAVQPELLNTIGSGQNSSGTALANSEELLLLLHKGNVVTTIAALSKRSEQEMNVTKKERFLSVARDVSAKWCDTSNKKQCDAAM